jgi:dihydrodipicolinate synthase/N-acetylneuraminate lyase
MGTGKLRVGVSRDALLEKRDRYIAARINATLAAGETGILFQLQTEEEMHRVSQQAQRNDHGRGLLWRRRQDDLRQV